MKSKSHPFRLRPFISVVVSICFLLLIVTGVVLFLAPPGRIANWTDWRILALSKHDWIGLHIWFAVVFLLAGLVHLWFNLRPLVSYFRSRASRHIGLRWEWVAAGILCMGIFVGTRSHLPPFSTLLAWNEQLKEGWDAPESRAPIAHAELLTLEELLQQAGVAWEPGKERLEAAGLRQIDPTVVVGTLAAENQLSPAQIYRIITGDHGQAANLGGGSHTSGQGRGYGGKSLQVVCEELGLDITQVQVRL